MNFSVSVHYLLNSTTHSTQTWHMDMFLECPGQVRIWSWFNDFWQSKSPFTLKIIWNLQFPINTLSTQQYYIFNSNLTYGYVKGMGRSSWNLVKVQWFFGSYVPFTLKIIEIHLRNKQFKFEFGRGSLILNKLTFPVFWKKFELSVSAVILLWKCM
jgi:hypothetical protein